MSQFSNYYPEFLGDEAIYPFDDCDSDFERWVYEMEQMEMQLDGLGTSDLPPEDDDGPMPPAVECWLGSDAEIEAYEQRAEAEGLIPRTA